MEIFETSIIALYNVLLDLWTASELTEAFLRDSEALNNRNVINQKKLSLFLH